ncbi:MAG: histidine--tRNA ligase [Candidatus Doudnabacteria bacterium]|nr:histidine--tRNA ligase [Candidatus Doudnabacteria bacterium]
MNNNPSKVTPRILSGFMELLPADQMLFNGMLGVIQKSYERFGFIPLDTPVIELAEVLLAKAGGETEKQIYRFTKGDSDLALRFDLTVPLARYVAQHYPDLAFPFRRYHIGKVFRGERPQRGRFREFYQCDIDIIGDGALSLLNDAEIPSVIYATFAALGFSRFTIKINNRKILNGFFESLGLASQAADILRSVDRLEKAGQEAVQQELAGLGVPPDAAREVLAFIGLTGDTAAILSQLKQMQISNGTFRTGVDELEKVISYVSALGVPGQNYAIDLTIARGLDYYTGTVYETVLNDYPGIGSVCSGGRYDDLAGYYTNKQLPGVGISIGLTRLFYQLREAGIITPKSATPAIVLVIPQTSDLRVPLQAATELREGGIPTAVYFDDAKLKKKVTYASRLGIPFIIVIGDDEVAGGYVSLKDMSTGQTSNVSTKEAISLIRAKESANNGPSTDPVSA